MAEAFKRAVSRVSACLRHHLAFSRRPHTLSRHQVLLFCGYLLPLFLTCSQSKQSVFLCVCSASNFTWVDRRSHLDDMENKEAEKNICIYCKYVSTEYLLVPLSTPPLHTLQPSQYRAPSQFTEAGDNCWCFLPGVRVPTKLCPAAVNCHE